MGTAPQRRTIRLQAFDYRETFRYFVTICTLDRRLLFGDVVGEVMHLGPLGRAVEECWLDLPRRFPFVSVEHAYVVMPNHVHGILRFDHLGSRPLGAVVGAFKGAVTARADHAVWQRNYYEHVIRDDRSLELIANYITGNPSTWASDPENPAAMGRDGLETLLEQLRNEPRSPSVKTAR